MTEVASQGREVPEVVRPRPYAGDLQGLVPIGIEQCYPDEQTAIFLLLCRHTHRIPHFQASPALHKLPNGDFDRIC